MSLFPFLLKAELGFQVLGLGSRVFCLYCRLCPVSRHLPRPGSLHSGSLRPEHPSTFPHRAPLVRREHAGVPLRAPCTGEFRGCARGLCKEGGWDLNSTPAPPLSLIPGVEAPERDLSPALLSLRHYSATTNNSPVISELEVKFWLSVALICDVKHYCN